MFKLQTLVGIKQMTDSHFVPFKAVLRGIFETTSGFRKDFIRNSLFSAKESQQFKNEKPP